MAELEYLRGSRVEHLPGNEPSPYVDENEHLIILPLMRFRDHFRIQEWLNGTERNDEFTLVITDVEERNTLKTVCALKPTTEKAMFYWKLRGDAGAEELLQEILDYKLES